VVDTCYVGCTPSTTVPSATPTTLGGGGGAGGIHVVTSSLPFTGADVIELLVIGVVLIAVGVLLLPRRRHSTPTA